MESNIVRAGWLVQRLDDPSVRIVDCRFDLRDPQKGRTQYAASHILGAIYLDLEQDLSGPVREHGGRHPLPDVQRLAQTLGKYGVDETVTVVAYDDQGGAFAARLWWLLRYLGHRKVYVLDQGFSHWAASGYPVSDAVPEVQPRTFTPHLQDQMVVHMQDVKAKLESTARSEARTILLDSREYKRYTGLEEPIDPVAGHIPGARHAFWKDGLRSDGTWKDREEQIRRFQHLDPNQEVIVYCGSGVTACPNILALTEAGFQNVKLYAGSWSDWCSYPDNPIATGEEHGESDLL
jgi:thiosulfate/3-mercaptopyruvate sulfurtransferase